MVFVRFLVASGRSGSDRLERPLEMESPIADEIDLGGTDGRTEQPRRIFTIHPSTDASSSIGVNPRGFGVATPQILGWVVMGVAWGSRGSQGVSKYYYLVTFLKIDKFVYNVNKNVGCKCLK